MTRTGIAWLLLPAVVLVVLGVRPGAVRAQIEVGFDDPHLALPPESYWNGSQRYYFDDPGREDGEFISGGLVFNNHFHADPSHNMEYWDGWAYSNMTDTTTPGFGNQYSAIAGSGAGPAPGGMRTSSGFLDGLSA